MLGILNWNDVLNFPVFVVISFSAGERCGWIV